MGFDAKNCLVVEDSPFGIQAGVATGGKTIAVGTSHPHEKSESIQARVQILSCAQGISSTKISRLTVSLTLWLNLVTPDPRARPSGSLA